jgi:imidazole glycerol-phosphate synthase subunit HisF
MLRPRIIPCLLVHKNGLVKTVGFAEPKYVGDPINAVRIFNEKEVDELIVLDIDATVNDCEPDYAMIRNLAAECRMPLAYGGGIRSLDQAVRIVKMGVEKIALSSALVSDPALVTSIATHIGNQSVVGILDVRRDARSGNFEVWTHNATRNTGLEPAKFAAGLEELGVGEITLNSIDRDGTMMGYDLELVRRVRAAVTVPITVLGGAGSLDHLAELVREFGIIGAAAGSLFVFKGVYRAVLINYPRREQKTAIASAGQSGGTA